MSWEWAEKLQNEKELTLIEWRYEFEPDQMPEDPWNQRNQQFGPLLIMSGQTPKAPDNAADRVRLWPYTPVSERL